MLRTTILGFLFGFTASLTYAGSCSDCEITYREHHAACREDATCEQRAKEAFDRCQIGCSTNKSQSKKNSSQIKTELAGKAGGTSTCSGSAGSIGHVCTGCAVQCEHPLKAQCKNAVLNCNPSGDCKCVQNASCSCN